LVVATKAEDEVVVDEVDSEKTEVEEVDITDTLDDLNCSTSMLLLKSMDLKEAHTWVHLNTVCHKVTTLIPTTAAATDTDMDTWLLPTLECRTTPLDPMGSLGSTSEDPVDSPLPTGQFTMEPTLGNSPRLMKVPPLHRYTATITEMEWKEVSCGINSSCHSTTVNSPLPTVITPTSTNIR
jgi:hypothetical protein